MSLPKKINIVEVGPRDGLQNEKKFLASRDKIDFINALSQTGLKHIEATSFVSEKAIPQLKDATEVFRSIHKPNDIHYYALVPNVIGLEKAIDAGVKNIALFTASSNQFTQKNIGCDVKESLNRFEAIAKAINLEKMNIRAYISCAIACPYEGKTNPGDVFDLAKNLLELGAKNISLGDTIGVATPKETLELLNAFSAIDNEKIGMHFHNTYGQAIANVYQSMLCGISTFDSSVAGLGGCPYAKGASGNVASEDIIYLCQGLGIETGVDLGKLAKVGDALSKKLGRKNHSNVAVALLNQS